jgi:UDP-glucose 4-epimerase
VVGLDEGIVALMSRTKTVMVTGGAGYIGSHVVLALRSAGWDVVILDDLSTGSRDLIPADVPLVVGDVADQEKVRTILRDYECYGVLHFAGAIVVPESVSNPLKYYKENVSASRNLIEVCVEEDIGAFVFSSTASVYGAPEVLPVDENSPTQPESPYGSSKLMTEWILRDVSAASNLNTAILRYFNVAGADPDGRTGQMLKDATHLIKVACQTATGTRDHMYIYGDDYDTPDGTCLRDYIHVSDLADAHVLALDYILREQQNLLMNCGYGHGFSVREVVDTVGRAVGQELPVIVGPRRPGDVASLIATSDKARTLLGWKPKHDDLEVIVQTALEWEMKLVAKRATDA